MEQIAWCTGFFEGGGSIHLSTQYNLQITVVNTQKELLEPFLIFGGTITSRGKPKGNNKEAFQWRLNSGIDKTKEFLLKIQPFIISSKYRDRLNHALDFIEFVRVQPKYMYARDINKYMAFRNMINGTKVPVLKYY